MTVIYGDCGDIDTKVLANLWKDCDNAKVLGTYDLSVTQSVIDAALDAEDDILVMCGHGSPEGLFGANGYAVNRTNLHKIHAKTVIGIWCNANAFAERYGAKGFYSSMYISNLGEAMLVLGRDVKDKITQQEITSSETEFCLTVNKLLREERETIATWPEVVLQRMPPKNPVEEYNHTRLKYYS